jgi:hypothetical protein
MPEQGKSADQGVVLPTDDAGKQSSTKLAKAVLADAVRGCDPALASRIESESDWRSNYNRHILALHEAVMRSPADALKISADGLHSLRTRMQFHRDGGVGPIDEAMANPGEAFGTATVRGAAGAPRPLTVPYKGRTLAGDSLRKQLDVWVEGGIVEPSFAESVSLVIDNPDWLDISDQDVAVLGAGSEMGPFAHLAGWGARVWALDLPRPAVWQRVLATARSVRGEVRVPVPAGHRFDGATVGDADLDALAEVAGANLIASAPEVCAWLSAAEGPLTVGHYVYADGAVHVRVSEAVDAIMTHLQQQRDDLAIAFLATPTDVFTVPWDAVTDAQRRHDQHTGSAVGTMERPVERASRGQVFKKHYEATAHPEASPPYGIADNLVVRQGPNYALAKRMQRWRAIVARSQGVTVSLNIAPPTRTQSVVKNRTFALAYAGMGRYGIEVFDPPASNALSAAMLVHDLRNPDSVAKPGTPLVHPLDLFVAGANPGGLWRCPYEPNSIMAAATVAGLFERRA